tara:strand:+ start:23996 stop:25219 length:1224 start_codon:yes stop_codon:yes gene_type:complete
MVDALIQKEAVNIAESVDKPVESTKPVKPDNVSVPKVDKSVMVHVSMSPHTIATVENVDRPAKKANFAPTANVSKAALRGHRRRAMEDASRHSQTHNTVENVETHVFQESYVTVDSVYVLITKTVVEIAASSSMKIVCIVDFVTNRAKKMRSAPKDSVYYIAQNQQRFVMVDVLTQKPTSITVEHVVKFAPPHRSAKTEHVSATPPKNSAKDNVSPLTPLTNTVEAVAMPALKSKVAPLGYVSTKVAWPERPSAVKTAQTYNPIIDTVEDAITPALKTRSAMLEYASKPSVRMDRHGAVTRHSPPRRTREYAHQGHKCVLLVGGEHVLARSSHNLKLATKKMMIATVLSTKTVTNMEPGRSQPSQDFEAIIRTDLHVRPDSIDLQMSYRPLLVISTSQTQKTTESAK